MFNDTKSFELITLIEQIPIKNRIKNSLLFILKFETYNFIMSKIKLRKKMMPKEQIELYKDIFKQFFDIYNKFVSEGIDIETSHMTYTTFNNKIDCIISYSDLDIVLYITYDLSTDYFTLFIKINDKGVNIDERNLQIEYIRNMSRDVLDVLFTDAMTKLLAIYVHSVKMVTANGKED